MDNSTIGLALTPTQFGIIKIIKAAIRSTKEELPKDFDWQEAIQIIKKQRIYGLIFFGLRNMEIDIPEQVQELFIRDSVFLTMLCDAAERVMRAFDDEGIEYIQLKGIKMREIYPEKLMRHMSDVDILVHQNDYENKIRPIMQRLGWKEGIESNHEWHWDKGNSCIELHKRIIPSYNDDYYGVIGDGWEWLKEHSDFEYAFIHFAKHFRDAGIGISHLIELEMCWEDVDFSELKLNSFKDNVRKTLDCWFNDGELDENVRFINNMVFCSGEYGIRDIFDEFQNIRRAGYTNKMDMNKKIGYRLRLIFPSWEQWKLRNPILKKCPVLLPFLWIGRTFAVMFNRKKLKVFNKNLDVNDAYYNKLAEIGLITKN